MFSNSPLLFSNKMQRFAIILPVLMITLCLMIENIEAGRDRPRCEKPDYIPNGSYRMRRDRVMRILCKQGFQLQGPKTIECIRGKWDGEKPVCAKKGCKHDLIEPENGRIQIESDVKAILYCSENYNLAGNRHSYCNGTHWDRPIGNCREHKNVVQHTCDFETDDICGWTYEQREGLEWKRVMAANVFTSFKTGPRHDHTTMKANGGHYMLMESLTPLDVPVILTSPIYDRSLSLKTACCFQFYYFMYGAGVGDLLVVVKPVSLSLDEIFQKRKEFIKFEKNGNQNNIWNEAHFNIEELEEDFQILFVAKAGQGQLSDIAVDDVRLLTGDSCKVFDKKDDEDSSNEEYDSTTYESIFEMQSCEGRCFDGQGVGLIKYSGHLKGLCSCEIDCEDNDTCCPDYRTVCLKELFAEYTTATYPGEENTKQNEELLKSTATSTTTATPIISTISTTPSTVKTTPTTPSTTTTTTTMKTTTKINTTPSTLKTVPTTKITPTTIIKKTVKTIPTTVRTTPISTTIKPTSTQTTTISTSTKQTTPSTTTTPKTTTASPTTTTISSTTTTTTPKPKIVDNKISQVTTPIPNQKPMEYIINDKPNVEIPHRGSNLLLFVFIVIASCILAAVVCRRFGSKVADWYKIQFKPNASGDEDSTSIIASYKGPTSNGSIIGQKTKKCVNKKTKKTSPGNNSMATPLIVDVDDDDDDNDMATNGNIALKNHIYTEL